MLPHPTISTKLLTSWFLTRQKHPIKGKGGVRTSTSPEIWHRGIEDTTILHRFMELFRQLQRRRRVAALRRAAAALPYIAGYQTHLILLPFCCETHVLLLPAPVDVAFPVCCNPTVFVIVPQEASPGQGSRAAW